jgi:hypothetical protein
MTRTAGTSAWPLLPGDGVSPADYPAWITSTITPAPCPYDRKRTAIPSIAWSTAANDPHPMTWCCTPTGEGQRLTPPTVACSDSHSGPRPRPRPRAPTARGFGHAPTPAPASRHGGWTLSISSARETGTVVSGRRVYSHTRHDLRPWGDVQGGAPSEEMGVDARLEEGRAVVTAAVDDDIRRLRSQSTTAAKVIL